MSKKAIWIIIGLMSAAVIGVVWLQVDLIGTSMRVNEEKFDKDVFKSLKKVAERLEEEERRKAINYYSNGYSNAYYRESQFLSLDSKIQLSIIQQSLKSGNLRKSQQSGNGDQSLFDQLYDELTSRGNEFSKLLSGNSNIPLDERIRPDRLNELLELELADNGISTEFEYGVYSRRKRDFVIVNDHFVVNEDRPANMSNKNIYKSKYRAHLFPGESPVPGLLMIYFPQRSSIVWSSLWLTILGTILFTGLILICFGYTIDVILKQKKVSMMKNDFINNMTHEFKTPIATISLAADSITSPMISGKPEKVSRFANIIKQENKRMNSQVEKVLQMALIDKRDFSLKLTSVNLHEVIDRAVENIELQVDKKKGTVTTMQSATNPMVEGDMTHISNMINNLLDNANKYSPEQPEISVHTRNVPNGVEVIIKDKGIGMSKEARKNIFDKFYRVHTGNLHDVKGFGLGLSYVKAMITAHKGQIDVKSELGKGSSFILFFPFHVETNGQRQMNPNY
ncbi:MAG: HAMP domain-containing sensor histidine kinase [Bacteroidota bacterium]